MSTEVKTEHPHIVRAAEICSGSPIIRGTRITVRHVVVLWKDGESVDDIVRAYPHLQPSWVYDAISYYLDHQREIDQEIEDSRMENVLAKHGATMDEKGVVRFPRENVKDGQ